MSNADRVLPECYGDTALIEMLGYKSPNHQLSGIGQVLKVMEEKLKKQKVVGIIDDDKKKTSHYYKFFQKEDAKNGLIKLKHSERNHYLIVVQPAFDMFVWNAALEKEIDPSRFGFRTFEIFKKASKKQGVGRNQRFKDFLNTIKQKRAPAFETLRIWIEDIVGEPL